MSETPGDQKPRHHHGFRNHMNRSRPSHYHKGSGSESRQTKVRSDPWQSVSALQLGLHPRPFDELHTERLCLLGMLQLHNKQALELFEQVPIAEENIQKADTPYKLRQAKKNRGWLRHRITDIVDKEKKVLARLSELHVEIQCQERWVQVEMDRVARGLSQQHHNPNFQDFLAPPISPWPQANPPPVYSAYHSPYGGIVYPSAPSWDAFPSQGAYPGYYWADRTYICPSNVPEIHHTPERSEMDGAFTSNALDDMSSSHLEVTARRSPELEQPLPSTPPPIGEDRSEHNPKRCNSAWF
ncbi:uncharacterized protein F4817DRAFT_129162 [Daldinia loculata]|uniref:uncharacterized protein n=1 Tax=Daldinia loculata TaxID=103429 RepID=UPI0020C26863|nr:uncharacterized protein F4817DRAFT_129162 [Daldinia loculata]KAI1651365.1 hypothetical protein F4817DRAFT_129162 [Daldinia loculata]